MTVHKKNIVIVDYGVGNLHSLKKVFEFCGVEPSVSEDAEIISKSDAVVLPGVGSFEAGMRGIKLRGLADAVIHAAEKDKPMLGICLGAQIMLSKGYEFGEWDGLSIFPGKVIRFPELRCSEKIPHIGWNQVARPQKDSWKDSIFKTLPDNFSAYFVHSYILSPDNQSYSFGVTEYGGYGFCSAMKKGNVYGVQFHPEKSGRNGISIIKNFIKLL